MDNVIADTKMNTVSSAPAVQNEQEESEERKAFRRRRVKRIKVFLVITLIVFILIPYVFCGFLLYKLNQMNSNIDSLKEEIKLSKEEIERRTKQSGSALTSGEETLDSQSELYELEQSHLTDEEKYPGKQLVYLTFDDGPSKYTDEILDILAEYDVKATFFTIAKEGYDDQYNRIVSEGHTLGMHSYSHKYSSIYASLDCFAEDVTAISSFLTEKTGIRPKFYRFPGGSSNKVSKTPVQDMIHYLSSEDYVYYDWNVSSEDASSTMRDTNVIVKNVVNGVGNKTTAVVLMHDAASKRTTVEALPIIIETLQKKGNVVFLPITDGTKQIFQVKEKVTESKEIPKEETTEETDDTEDDEVSEEEEETEE